VLKASNNSTDSDLLATVDTSSQKVLLLFYTLEKNRNLYFSTTTTTAKEISPDSRATLFVFGFGICFFFVLGNL
jgi:hypothetical protein